MTPPPPLRHLKHFWIWDIFEFETFLKNADPPFWSIWDIFEIGTILMSTKPPRTGIINGLFALERLNFIQKGQNESRYPQVDIKTGIFAWGNTKKVSLFFFFLDGVWGLFLIQTFLKNREVIDHCYVSNTFPIDSLVVSQKPVYYTDQKPCTKEKYDSNKRRI